MSEIFMQQYSNTLELCICLQLHAWYSRQQYIRGLVILWLDSKAALQVQRVLQQFLAQWHTCQPHTNNYLALSRLATLVAYNSSRVNSRMYKEAFMLPTYLFKYTYNRNQYS